MKTLAKSPKTLTTHNGVQDSFPRPMSHNINSTRSKDAIGKQEEFVNTENGEQAGEQANKNQLDRLQQTIDFLKKEFKKFMLFAQQMRGYETNTLLAHKGDLNAFISWVKLWGENPQNGGKSLQTKQRIARKRNDAEDKEDKNLGVKTPATPAIDTDSTAVVASVQQSCCLTLTIKEIQCYVSHLIADKKMKASSVSRNLASIKNFIFYCNTVSLEQKKSPFTKGLDKEIVKPRYRQHLPPLLSIGEVEAIIAASPFSSMGKKTNQKSPTTPKNTKNKPSENDSTGNDSSLATSKSEARETRDRLLVTLLYFLGLRISEALTLRVGDFHADATSLRIVGKGNKQRIVPLPTNLRESVQRFISYDHHLLFPKHFFTYKRQTKHKKASLSTHGKETSHKIRNLPLFPNSRGEVLSRISAWKIVKQRVHRSGITEQKNSISPHTFRHSFATHLLHRGAALAIIQRLLGHANIQTTEVYTHVADRDLKRAIKKYHPFYE